LLPTPMAIQLARLEQYGFIILIVLMFTGILGKIISPIIHLFERLIYMIFM